MAILITDEDLKQSNLTAEEMKLEIAIVFYKSKRYSIGKAAEFAGISKMAFYKALAEREIPLNFSADHIDQELSAAKKYHAA